MSRRRIRIAGLGHMVNAPDIVAQRELEVLASRLRPVFDKHRVLRAIVFGSLARGERSRRSDLDLLVVQDTDKRFLDRYDELLREIAQVVSEQDVDLLIYTPAELKRMAERPFIARVMKEGQTIYESKQEEASS